MPAEIVNCPDCKRKLRVPEDLMGKQVRCPTCNLTFTAMPGDNAPSLEGDEPAPSERQPPASRPQEQFEDEPRSARRQPVRREEREEDYAEDDYDDEPARRRRRPLRHDWEPHRGTLILVLGILSLVVCGILGPFAWVMGKNDLQAMQAGRMDPEGEGLTKAGKICGMIATIIIIVVCSIYALIFLAFGLTGLR